jgi:two-component system LytT family sensor kinase
MNTTGHHITPQRLRELFGIAIALMAIWIVAGLFTASEFYRRAVSLHGWTEEFPYIMGVQTITGLLWATITPILVGIAERLPLRRPVLVRNALILTGLLPVISVLRTILGSIVLNLGEHQPVSMEMMQLSLRIRTHRNIAIGALVFVVTNLVIAQREAAARARRELAAQTLLAHTELADLRTQMQPHFLFLTLQTIADVVHVDPATADDMIVRLSDLLRRGLALGNDPVSLADELEFVDRTLALYQICYGGKLTVRFEADEYVLAARVPPLLVQQLVASAVAHGIAPSGGGALEVRGWHDGARLHVAVSDSGGGIARDDEYGLAPVRTRLEKLFGTAQSLSVSRDAKRFVTTISLPLEEL